VVSDVDAVVDQVRELVCGSAEGWFGQVAFVFILRTFRLPSPGRGTSVTSSSRQAFPGITLAYLAATALVRRFGGVQRVLQVETGSL